VNNFSRQKSRLEREARQIAGAPSESSASDEQIRALRTEAAQAGDHAQALICDVAIGDVDPDDGYEHLRIWPLLSKRDQGRVAGISTSDEARAICASALSAASSGPQVPMPPRGRTSPIQAAVAAAGHFANKHTLERLGFREPSINAAVRRGELRWTRDGNLEVVSGGTRS